MKHEYHVKTWVANRGWETTVFVAPTQAEAWGWVDIFGSPEVDYVVEKVEVM